MSWARKNWLIFVQARSVAMLNVLMMAARVIHSMGLMCVLVWARLISSIAVMINAEASHRAAVVLVGLSTGRYRAKRSE